MAVPRSFLSTLKAGFFSLAQTGLETALLAGRAHRGMECRPRLWMSITGSSAGDACKIARSSWTWTSSAQSVGGPRAGESHRRFERFAEVCQGLPSRGLSHPGLLPPANLRLEVSRLLSAVSSESDVATTPKGTQNEAPRPPGP
jgi:hypothetical protein